MSENASDMIGETATFNIGTIEYLGEVVDSPNLGQVTVTYLSRMDVDGTPLTEQRRRTMPVEHLNGRVVSL